MRRHSRLICLVFLLSVCPGCAAIAESVIDTLINAAHGEDSGERADREEMERHRAFWSTPGRSTPEVDAEARATFRKKNGRDPNLNWHAR